MSDDMMYVDSSQIEVTRRKRKPKYKHKIWESEDPKDQSRYLMMCSRSYKRHVQRNGGVYNEDDDPFINLVTDRHRYEIECEKVFDVDLSSVDVSDLDAVDDAEKLCNNFAIRIGDMVNQLNDLDEEDEFFDDQVYFMIGECEIMLDAATEMVGRLSKYIQSISNDSIENVRVIIEDVKELHNSLTKLS